MESGESSNQSNIRDQSDSEEDVEKWVESKYGHPVPTQSSVQNKTDRCRLSPRQGTRPSVQTGRIVRLGESSIDSFQQQSPNNSQTVGKTPPARSRNKQRNKKTEQLEARGNSGHQPTSTSHASLDKNQSVMGKNPQRDNGFEPKAFIVSGLSETTPRDMFTNYMKNITDNCVKEITFLDDGRAIVYLSKEPDFKKLKSKIRFRKLRGMQLKANRIPVCDSILVSGFSSVVTKDTIMLYFENVRRSGGGEVASVDFSEETLRAVVTFVNSKVVGDVIARKHNLEDKELTVKKYYPLIDKKIENMEEVNSNDEAEEETGKKVEAATPTRICFQEKRQKISSGVDPDIVEFVVRGGHFQTLENSLYECGGKIEWKYGSNSVSIKKRSDSQCPKNWETNCRSVLTEFFNQFQKFSIPLEESLGTAVTEALPRRLTELISPVKALGKTVQETQKLFCVVFLREERECVLQCTQELLKTIRNEEILRTYTKETIKENVNRLYLLKHIGFVEEMREKYPELKITLDSGKCELSLEGPPERIFDAKQSYVKIVNDIFEETLHLPQYIATSLHSKAGTELIHKKLMQEKIAAVFLSDENNVVKLLCKSSEESGKAIGCLFDSVTETRVPYPSGQDFIFMKREWKQLSRNLRAQQLVNLTIDNKQSCVVLSAVADIGVEISKKQITDFIESQNMKEKQKGVPKLVARFLNQNMSNDIKDIECQLKDEKVSFTINETNGVISYRGTENGIQVCTCWLDEILGTVIAVKKEYSSPGLSKLLEGKEGQRYKKAVEAKGNVIIELTTDVSHDVKETTVEEIKSIRKVLELEEEKHSAAAGNGRKPVTNVHSASSGTYDFCNFTTTEGITISWKYGNIADEHADVLVNSAQSDLSNPTACGKALNTRGGPSFVQECRNYRGINYGEVVQTSGGNLSCIYVLHAVCCNWDNYQGQAEQLLRTLVKQILFQCNQLGVSSLAMPAIGTGNLKFPEKVVFWIFRKEFEHFSSSQPSTTLRDIRIVIFSKGKGMPTKQASSSPHFAPPPRPVIIPATLQRSLPYNSFSPSAGLATSSIFRMVPSSSFPQAGPTIPGFHVTSFGQIRVSVVQGDITKHPVDAIINALPSDLQLSSGGVVCQNILRAGGQVIQQQLNNVVKPSSPSGFTVQTTAGSMQTAKSIIHFVSHSTGAQHLENLIEECLNDACKLSLPSVSIAAIGTGSFGLTARQSAEVIANAVVKFSTQNFSLNIDIVVFRQELVQDFQTVIKEQARRMATVSAPVGRVPFPSSSYSPQPVQSSQSTPQSLTVALFQPLNTGEPKQSVKLHFVGRSKQKINASFDEMKKFIDDHMKTKKVQNENVFDVFIQQWEKIERLAVRYEVKVTCTKPSLACIEGLEYEVGECEKELLELMDNHARQKRKIHQLTTRSEISVPQHWTTQPAFQVVQLVTLQTSSPEYQQVLTHFRNRGGTAAQIVKIERVQNPGLYKAYLVKKESMKGAENEQQLFHGTAGPNTATINTNNFSRSYAGINGTACGNGVYFARDASYSLRFAQADSNGYRYMYVAKVLVGTYTNGHQGMKAPPSRNDPNNPGLLFDSVVDNVHNPSMFVIFQDHQCYPEYLITFI